ncbi:MAG: HlyD family type I secretion periplasmic adaptor subunit [Rhodobacteraceae bacterium]|nr:HlyD family type I secretion periplasmic adaptor subunit [Paracoccaceae bacterium]
MSSGDWNYANDIRDVLRTKPPRHATNVIRIGLALFACAVLWAYFATLEEVTRGEGRVVPSRQIQVVQSLETGIVKDLLIEEGDIVEKGQTLIRIDDTDFGARLGEIRQKRWSLLARIARLQSETEGSELTFSPKLQEAVPSLVAEERNVFNAKIRRLESERALLRNQRTQREQEFLELKAKESKLHSVLELMDRELEISENLYKRKVVPEIEFLRQKRQVNETRGELAITKASLLKTEAAKQEAEERLRNADNTFVSEAQQELATVRGELGVIDQTIRGAADRVRRTDLTSPVKGVINRLNVTTIGAVVQPGADIVEIVPLEDTLLIETEIRPQDVAFLSPGQKAQVKITAYDYSIYGGLQGTLERISADTTEDEKGNRFFRVMIRTNKNFLGSDTNPLPIIPGMVASVDILTGKKSVLDYILKPIKKVRDEALRER